MAGRLRAVTADHGLSLGDRFCLALAQRDGLPAWTSDQSSARRSPMPSKPRSSLFDDFQRRRARRLPLSMALRGHISCLAASTGFLPKAEIRKSTPKRSVATGVSGSTKPVVGLHNAQARTTNCRSVAAAVFGYHGHNQSSCRRGFAVGPTILSMAGNGSNPLVYGHLFAFTWLLATDERLIGQVLIHRTCAASSAFLQFG